MPQDRRLAAIVFTDIVGSTALMAQNEEAGLRAKRGHRELVRTQVDRYEGQLIEHPGDETLSIFGSALDAVNCALAIEESLREEVFKLHIGIHLGDVIVDGREIHGDAVNVAARLLPMSEGGGTLISGEVHASVRNQRELSTEDLGSHDFKNVGRPIQVHRISTQAEPVASAAPVRDLWRRPAIAVLSFENLSGDPDQEFFADGIAEDLITRLSLCRAFPVIARNSSFVYKGHSVDIKQVGSELGVRYVVEGSIRTSGQRVRVSIQLVDATTGQHVWARNYDRELDDVFALHDELTTAIVATIYPELEHAELDLVRLRVPSSLSAWEAVIRGRSFLFSVERSNSRAREFFEQAIELDPYLVAAFYGLAVSHLNDLIDGTTDDRQHSMEIIAESARRCIAIDDQDALSHLALAYSYLVEGKRGELLKAAETAVQLNPSESRASYHVGHALTVNARYDEATAHLEQGIRLNPRDEWRFSQGLSMAHFGARRYETAINWAQRSLQHRPNGAVGLLFLIVSLAQLDRLEEAVDAHAQAKRMGLDLRPNRILGLAADPEFSERVRAAFGKVVGEN